MVDTARKMDATNSAPAVRDLTLDVVKGALVVVMVVYHAMNIFSTAGPDEYAYVRFVSGSFILNVGIHRGEVRWSPIQSRLARHVPATGRAGIEAVDSVHAAKSADQPDGHRESRQGPTWYSTLYKLSFRGLRIRGAGVCLVPDLLPIAYLLVAAPALLMLGKLSKWVFVASFAMVVASSLFGIELINLGFAVLGAIGLSGGMLTNAMEKPFVMRGAWSIAGCLLASVLLMEYLSADPATYAMGTIVILKLLYDLGKAVGPGSRLARASILLGQYSLVCYIAQIIFMQALSRALSRPRWELGYEIIFIVFVTVVFLLVLSAGLAMLSCRHRFVAKAYKLVFS